MEAEREKLRYTYEEPCGMEWVFIDKSGKVALTRAPRVFVDIGFYSTITTPSTLRLPDGAHGPTSTLGPPPGYLLPPQHIHTHSTCTMLFL